MQLVSALECVQLTEPGTTRVICVTREALLDQPVCVFLEQDLLAVPCKLNAMRCDITYICQVIIAGDDLNNIVLTSSDYLQYGVGNHRLRIIATSMITQERIRPDTFQVSISKFYLQTLSCRIQITF